MLVPAVAVRIICNKAARHGPVSARFSITRRSVIASRHQSTEYCTCKAGAAPEPTTTKRKKPSRMGPTESCLLLFLCRRTQHLSDSHRCAALRVFYSVKLEEAYCELAGVSHHFIDFRGNLSALMHVVVESVALGVLNAPRGHLKRARYLTQSFSVSAHARTGSPRAP